MKRILFTAAAAAALVAGSVAMAVPAMASNGPAQFVTHAANHPDTTIGGLPGTACLPGDGGGPVWASDNLTVQLTPVQIADPGDGANYRVDVSSTGSFAGFADPNSCAALASNGPVKGSISYDVLATGQPSGAGLLPQQDSTTHLRAMVLQLFPAGSQVVGGGDTYTFSYQNGSYVQDTSGVHGGLRGGVVAP
jgi:hypothetical protein